MKGPPAAITLSFRQIRSRPLCHAAGRDVEASVLTIAANAPEALGAFFPVARC